MEPFTPAFRKALKEAHPGLTDDTIDRAQALMAMRFQIDPEAEPKRLEQLDRERAEFLRREIPRFQEVSRKLRGGK